MSDPLSRRSNAASIAALTKWGHTDAKAGTAAARKAFLDRFEREADPDLVLDPDERARRAGRLRRAHFKRMAAKSVQSRAKKKAHLDEENGT